MLKPLNKNELLKMAAIDHYVDIAERGLMTHKSSDGRSTYKERIERHAGWGGRIFEGIQYGWLKKHARDVVLQWVIDDGFKDRQHRKALFAAELAEVGIVAGPHKTASFCFIAVFAAQVMDKR